MKTNVCPAHDINLSTVNKNDSSFHVVENLAPGMLHAGEDIKPGTLCAGEEITPGTLHSK